MQGYPLSTEASWVNYHMADAVVAPAELWTAAYSEAALLMPCSYHLNGHSVHKGQPPRRINGLVVEGGVDGKGYRCAPVSCVAECCIYINRGQSNQPRIIKLTADKRTTPKRAACSAVSRACAPQFPPRSARGVRIPSSRQS